MKKLRGTFYAEGCNKIEPAESSYSSEFVERIKESKRQVEAGMFFTLDPNKSLWENLAEFYKDQPRQPRL